MATAPVRTPPQPAYRPLWWLLPFLIGLGLGLALWGAEYTLRSATQHRKDVLQRLEQSGPRP
jgi:hypothetical protein